MKVGHSLLKEQRDCDLGVLARCLDVDVKTLWNWRKEAQGGAPAKRIGRPRYSAEIQKQALWKVGRELRRQGYPGCLAVEEGLKGEVPTRLIQNYVRLFKAKREWRRKARILRHQIRVEVLERDVIWGQDGTHVGRVLDGSDEEDEKGAIESQVLRDRGSLSVIGLHTGGPANHQDVIELLKCTARKRLTYPLVLCRDNGSPYHHDEVMKLLADEQVIVLRSLPRTPEHNGATECSIGELKDVAELGKGCRLEVHQAKEKMDAAAMTLNKNRIRASKGLKTSVELDEKLARPEIGKRDSFYKLCKARMNAALVSQKSVRAGRLAEREEVFRTLEEFGFIKRTRGGNPYVSKSEIVL
jgi:hypothetical protein